MSKPKLFIGSSSEGLDVANAIHQNLDNFAEVTVWNQGVFELSATTFNTLLDILNTFDFAIFVFTPDDSIKIRKSTASAARDNVIFETGLFLGKLGANKVYFIKPNDTAIHLPTDILGVTSGTYNPNRDDDNLVAATGPCSTQIKRKIEAVLRAATVHKKNNQDSFKDDKLEKDFNILLSYLNDKGWTTISFEKIQENIHPSFDESYVMKMIEAFSDRIRRCRIKEDKYGIKIIFKK